MLFNHVMITVYFCFAYYTQSLTTHFSIHFELSSGYYLVVII